MGISCDEGAWSRSRCAGVCSLQSRYGSGAVAAGIPVIAVTHLAALTEIIDDTTIQVFLSVPMVLAE